MPVLRGCCRHYRPQPRFASWSIPSAGRAFERQGRSKSVLRCFTPTSQWGKATYLLRRLCLLVYSKEADDDKHVAHIPYFAQACETGATESEAGPDEQRASISASALVFGGRKRPLVLDVRWIRSWMQICEEEHKEACFLHTDQVKHLQYVS